MSIKSQNAGIIEKTVEPEANAYMNDAQKIAFAGTGKPINEEVCRLSLLNFAYRNAENIGIKKATSRNSFPKRGLSH